MSDASDVSDREAALQSVAVKSAVKRNRVRVAVKCAVKGAGKWGKRNPHDVVIFVDPDCIGISG